MLIGLHNPRPSPFNPLSALRSIDMLPCFVSYHAGFLVPALVVQNNLASKAGQACFGLEKPGKLLRLLFIFFHHKFYSTSNSTSNGLHNSIVFTKKVRPKNTRNMHGFCLFEQLLGTALTVVGIFCYNLLVREL